MYFQSWSRQPDLDTFARRPLESPALPLSRRGFPISVPLVAQALPHGKRRPQLAGESNLTGGLFVLNRCHKRRFTVDTGDSPFGLQA
jgi:hypothetical protein